VHFVRQLVKYSVQKFGCYDAFGAGIQLGKRHFAGAVNGHKEVLAALFVLHFGEVDVQVVDGVIFKLLFR